MDSFFNYIKDSNLAGIITIILGLYLVYDGISMRRRDSNILRNPLKNLLWGAIGIILGILILTGYMKDKL
jgi:uncharacterized protein YacL